MLSTSQTKELEQIKADIELIETRIKTAHLLGDNGSAGGISHGYNDNQAWYSELKQLRARRNQLENIESGVESNGLIDAGILPINYIRNDQF
jgi:hypothetical protein